MARINVEPGAWTALRVEALHRNVSVADYLGHLITREADRLARRNTRRAERADGDGQPDDADVIDLDDDADPIPAPQPLPPSRSDWVPPWEP